MILATAATANANYPSDSGVEWRGGTGTLYVYGTFDSGTAKLQAKAPSGATWIDVSSDVSFTADGVGNFQLGPCSIRLNVAGGGGSLSVSGEVS